MAHNVLKMKYHPAKKKVEFEALQDGGYFSNYVESPLYYNYENKPFVLQQHGNAFFETIRTFFNGCSSVDLEVTTTKTDYEDLVQMIEYYKRDLAYRKVSFQLNPSLKAVLPEMDTIYNNVREYGRNAVEILKRHRADFHTICSDNEAAKQSIAIFSKDIQEEIENIQDKINRMDDNNVNLCFAGIYSAGKSSLINAILGCRILPEAIEPTTARSFRIRSPQDGEKIRIEFMLDGARMSINWDNTIGSFSRSLANNPSVKEITDWLETHKEEPQYTQLYWVLNYLNADSSVEPVIDVFVPIPLDTKNVRFTILDTPGTDSNTMQHGRVLREALKEHESSILIFVAPANHATDGKGNKDLLDLLENDGKAIDLDRSLFVLNYADVIDLKARETLKNSSIGATDEQSDEKFQIDLTAKKLFFTSAKAAYIAKAVQNGIAKEEEIFEFETALYGKATHEKYGRYYQDNHCATSDYATSRMLARCEEALKKAEGDKYQELVICSGLFALEDEIVRYGEKYASAVRAHAIIDSVDQALTRISGKTASLAAQTDKTLEQITAEIAKIRSGFTKAIEGQQEKFSITDRTKLSDQALQELHLTADFFGAEVINPSRQYLQKKTKFGQKVKLSEKQLNRIVSDLSGGLAFFEQKYVDGRQSKLNRVFEMFTHNVKAEICKNGGLSPDAVEYVCRIDPPKLQMVDVKKIKDIYEELKRSERFLFFTREYLKKKEFFDKLNEYFRHIQENTLSDYKSEFCKFLNSLLNETAAAYMTNLDDYSILLQAKNLDRWAMEKLTEKVNGAASDLRKLQEELDKIIWEAI